MISIYPFYHRLGNQLFQLAAAHALAQKNGDRVAWPHWLYAPYFDNDFDHMVSRMDYTFREPYFHYLPIEYRPHIAINGYFQSWKHFEVDATQELFAMSEFKRSLVQPLPTTIPLYTEGDCSVHVRRGDYVGQQNLHPVVSVEYIKNAMEVFGRNTNYVFFSDDIQWCQENFDDVPNAVFVHPIGMKEIPNTMTDFALMQSCGMHIIANSSYSWWAAYLSQNPTVAPKTWFGPDLRHNTQDLYLPDWTIV